MTSVDIPVHALNDPDPAGELEMLEEMLAEAPPRLHKVKTNLGSNYDRTRAILGYRVALGRPSDELAAALRDVVQWGVALFQRGLVGPTQTVHLAVGDTTVELPGGVSYYTSAPRWNATAHAAMVAGDRNALDELCRFNPGDFEGDYDDYHDVCARAIMAWHGGRSDLAMLLDEALKAAGTATVYPELGRALGVPYVRAARSVLLEQCEGFSELLVAGLEAYRGVYERPDFNHEAPAMVAGGFLGLCALAVDRGWDFGVRCEYVPERLVQAFR